MAKRKIKEVPEVELLENTFNFISDKTLRSNLSINLQYVIFLISVEEEFELPGPVSYSLFKNGILYIASNVEGVLHYTLSRLVGAGIVEAEKVMPFSQNKWIHFTTLFKIDDNTSIVAGKQKKVREKLDRQTQFKSIIRAAHKADIIDADLRDQVDNLRELRNRIHLTGLSHIDNTYLKEDINKQSDILNKVLEACRAKIEDLDRV